jgi:lipoprotein signal peptidase
MAERSYRWLLCGLVFFGTTLDQVSKYAVFRWLYQHPVYYEQSRKSGAYQVIPGTFELLAQSTGERDPEGLLLTPLRTWSAEEMPIVNKGALFGTRLGLDATYDWLPNVVFTIVSILAALAIAFWSTRPSTARDRFLCAALGLILAGTLGNLYDRLVFHGVRDFLHFYLIEWPVFNVADCCLVCGAFFLLIQAFVTRPISMPNEAEEVVMSGAAAEAK